jgi:hypothetical protein
VNGFVEFFLGPLAVPECRRTLNRGWVQVARMLAGIPGAIVALIVLWIWWFVQILDPAFQPAGTLLGGVSILERIMIVVAMLMSPAMIAGTLAGERARGVLPLLLASSISTREIVSGRLAGRIAIVGVFLLANMPAMCVLGGLAALPIQVLALLLVLPISVAIGAGGISMLASAVSRRARDALIAVYLVQLFLFLVPVLGWGVLPLSFWDVIGPTNPFYGVDALAEAVTLLPALKSCVIWICLGLLGVWMASWRLRIAYVKQADSSPARDSKRERVRPALGDDPMLWKELHFERVGRFSRFVWWVGTITFTLLLAITLGLIGIILWARWLNTSDASWGLWASSQLEFWVGKSAMPLGWLIQWTVGLRAAVAVASEREHGTWDAILLSPLEGREIIRAKIWGNLYSLRGFIAAAAIVWTLASLVGAIDLETYCARLGTTVAVSIFITAAGVWISLSSSTATRAMTFTIGTWLIAAACFAVMAAMIVAVLTMLIFMAWLAITQTAFVSGGKLSGPPTPISFATGMTIARVLLYTVTALLIAIYCRHRFDSLAGRARQKRK